jgi:hypothetical protein
MTLANGKSRRGLVRASGAAMLGMLIGAALTWLPLQTSAGEPDPAQEEFVAFLEYLGSWDGQEEEWVQFLDAADRDASRTKPGAAAAVEDAARPATDTDPELQLATAGAGT